MALVGDESSIKIRVAGSSVPAGVELDHWVCASRSGLRSPSFACDFVRIQQVLDALEMPKEKMGSGLLDMRSGF
jgi:hypothetical protein